MIQIVRLCGTIALITGILSWFAYRTPLLVHLVSGGLLVSALCILAIQTPLTKRTALAFGAVIFIPLLGLLELRPVLGQLQWTLQWIHPAAGVGGMGLAEVLAKHIRLNQQKEL